MNRSTRASGIYCAAGLDAGKVAGQRAYDEGKTAVLAGLAAGAGILLSQGPGVFFLATTWIWGIALPMSAVGIATHYLASLRLSWAKFWQQREINRLAAPWLVAGCFDESRINLAVHSPRLLGAL